MTLIQERLVKNFAILIMAGIKTIDEVPIELQDAVVIKKAEIENEKLINLL